MEENMGKDTAPTLDEVMNGKPERKVNWSAFVEADVANFFIAHDLEKMAVEDGNGNKAKLTRQKDNGIKVEYSSMTIL
jgi:uncharacterized membrane-anchored protein